MPVNKRLTHAQPPQLRRLAIRLRRPAMRLRRHAIRLCPPAMPLRPLAHRELFSAPRTRGLAHRKHGNDKDHRPRAARVQNETEASPRGSVHPLVRPYGFQCISTRPPVNLSLPGPPVTDTSMSRMRTALLAPRTTIVRSSGNVCVRCDQAESWQGKAPCQLCCGYRRFSVLCARYTPASQPNSPRSTLKTKPCSSW